VDCCIGEVARPVVSTRMLPSALAHCGSIDADGVEDTVEDGGRGEGDGVTSPGGSASSAMHGITLTELKNCPSNSTPNEPSCAPNAKETVVLGHASGVETNPGTPHHLRATGDDNETGDHPNGKRARKYWDVPGKGSNEPTTAGGSPDSQILNASKFLHHCTLMEVVGPSKFNAMTIPVIKKGIE
jgi:hypothetical protein